MRSLYAQPAQPWRAVSPLLPLEPHPRFRREDGHGAARGRDLCARRAERLHVHRLHARYGPVFHEGEPGAAGRLSGVLRRDRPSRLHVGLPGRGLLGAAFLRHGGVLSDGRGDLQAEGFAGRLGAAAGQRLRRHPRALAEAAWLRRRTMRR
nr:hypothetical protein SHINE37_42334 [Rhizobiaceae bacterium]